MMMMMMMTSPGFGGWASESFAAVALPETRKVKPLYGRILTMFRENINIYRTLAVQQYSANSFWEILFDESYFVWAA